MFHVLRRRGGSATFAFIWLVLVYSTIVMTFGELVENQRVGFTDWLVVVLATVDAARLIGYLRRHHSRTAGTLNFRDEWKSSPARFSAITGASRRPPIALQLAFAVVAALIMFEMTRQFFEGVLA